MRFIMLARAGPGREAGEALLSEMGKYNEELVKAGVLLAAEGLHPASRGARVRFSGDTRTVAEGPFPPERGPVAGFWLIQVKSREEAVEWAKRCPNPTPGSDAEIEIRQVFGADDPGAERPGQQ